MKVLGLILSLSSLVFSSCTYDEVASFGRAADAAAAQYYRSGYTPVQPAQPVYPYPVY